MQQPAPAIMQPVKKQRLLSLDFFRGITVAGMILVNNPGDWEHVYAPLEHSKWNGCTPTDLVFPFFLFMVGVSITLSIGPKKDNKLSHRKLILTALKRSIIIYIISAAIHFLFVFNFHNYRILGVLPRIAIVFFISVVIYLKTNLKQQLWIFSIILIVYYLLMNFVPVPGVGYSNLEPSTNLAAWLDRTILTTKHMWSGSKTFDPEGILSTFPAISTCLFGIFVGTELRRKDKPEANKATWLFCCATLAIIAGLIWDKFFPINKALWTSSFVLYTSGLATAGLTLSYWLIDVQQRKKYITPFVAYGANAITAYVAADVVLAVLDWFHPTLHGQKVGLQQYLYETCFVPFFSPYNASVAGAITYVIILMIPMIILYKKKIFIKV
jgi:predicted acyltransferase